MFSLLTHQIVNPNTLHQQVLYHTKLSLKLGYGKQKAKGIQRIWLS